MAEKIVQTAGRDTLGEFAPEFAHYNDDILFGENWNNTDIDLKNTEYHHCSCSDVSWSDRQFPEISPDECKESRCFAERDCSYYYTNSFLCRLAARLGCIQPCKRGMD